MNIPRLEEIAQVIGPLVITAVQDLGSDLQGLSVIDLCADNLPSCISLSDIKSALVIAGVDSILSSRLRVSYSYRD